MFKAVVFHSNETAAKASVREAGMLELYLELSISCKLIILENL